MKIKTILVIFLLFSCVFITPCQGSPIRVVVDALCSNYYLADWNKNKTINFKYEGINITMTGQISKYKFSFIETSGRDVDVIYEIPKDYISATAVGEITVENQTEVAWNTNGTISALEFTLFAYQHLNFNVSKTNTIFGNIKKSVHSLMHYVEYDKYSNDKQMVIVNIDKKTLGFIVDNKHMIVQYKTKFHGWYYPLDDSSASLTGYYYVNDLPDTYQVVIQFKNLSSADVKVEVFPGASQGFFNVAAAEGFFARGFLSIQIGVKKAIIDLFHGSSPQY